MHFIARIALGPLVFAAGLSAADSAAGLPKKSPFELRGGPAAPAAAANETIEFAGVSSIGKKTDLIFYDKTAKKNHWISKGETKEGIEVINYDQAREEAVVKVNGVSKTLALRKGAGPVGGVRAVTHSPTGSNPLPPPLAAPVPAQIPVPNDSTPAMVPANTATATSAPAAPGTPAEIQTRQETEARMLVSDLLEIGMAQRRAYEEAQRKASDPAQNTGLPEPQAVQAQQQTQPPR